ncbi:Outer membrane protein (porin) [Candidatus Burkholderia humilis]|nr:Outer membrane protein (porin) [Candidatus Burkholderia humilis]
MYALGGIAGSTGKGQTLSGALSYSIGPVNLAAGYLRMDNAEGNTTPGFDPASTASFGTSALNQGYLSARSVRHVAAAGNYAFGGATLGLNYSNVRYLPGGASLFANTAVFNTYGALAVYRFTPAFDLAGALVIRSHPRPMESTRPPGTSSTPSKKVITCPNVRYSTRCRHGSIPAVRRSIHA